MFIKIENGGDQEPEGSDLTEVERREIEEILVDAYDEYEQAGAWEVAFEDGIEVPFSASLLGIDVKVTKFRVNDQNIVQCHVVRGEKKRWIGVHDLDDEGLPADFVHIRSLYRAWSSGRY
ncbi:MAG: calcium-binding protein [Capsulimonadaceae bacterium]|nr:calcium-binding protein [Capsulimonadaceae bacterium]